MRERRDGAGLALEPRQASRVAGERRGQDLDRDLAPEPRVPGAVDLAHPARAERGEDLVGAEVSARGEQCLRESLWSSKIPGHTFPSVNSEDRIAATRRQEELIADLSASHHVRRRPGRRVPEAARVVPDGRGPQPAVVPGAVRGAPLPPPPRASRGSPRAGLRRTAAGSTRRSPAWRSSPSWRCCSRS